LKQSQEVICFLWSHAPNTAGLQLTELDWPDRFPAQLDDLKATSGAHLPNLAIFALGECEFHPGGSSSEDVKSDSYGAIHAFTDGHSGPHSVERRLVGGQMTAYLHSVPLLERPVWMEDPSTKFTVVGKKQRAL